MPEKLHDSDKYPVPGGSDAAGKKKKVKQSNHDIYTIPSCMEAWADEPLYLVVARWGLQENRWINRNDIAAVFHIPERRASFQLSYISRKKERVVCRTRYVTSEECGRQRIEIFIDRILPEPGSCRSRVPPGRQNIPSKPTGPTSRRVGSGMVGNIGLWEQLLKGCRKEREDE
ncbi:TPA: CaiF/GrlA family transcriptional regulator [Salmonella enterica]|nr:CaiF/GrlA family transcriptional regulator [Salmonella enterica]